MNYAEILSFIYFSIALIGAIFWVKGNNLRTPAGILYISTIYYTQNLFVANAEAFYGLNPNAIPHYSLYFFYILLMVLIVGALSLFKERRLVIAVNVKELLSIRKIYLIQSLCFFIALNYFFLKNGVDLFKKSEVVDSGNKFFYLFHYSCVAILVINIACKERRWINYFFPVLDALFFLVLAYRAILVEMALIVLYATYFFNWYGVFFLKKWYIYAAGLLGFLVLAPFKYLINLLYARILIGSFPDFDIDAALTASVSGNEGSATMGIADMIVKANLELPDWYFVSSLLQHIPFVRQLFDLERVTFNKIFQDKIFGSYDFGVGSSPVAEIYHVGWLPGLIGLAFFVFILIRSRPRGIYLKLVYVSTIPGYLFFFHRIDWNQIFFVWLMFFYSSIIPFVLNGFLVFVGKNIRNKNALWKSK